MKNTIFAVLALFGATAIHAQIEAPQPSPAAMTQQTVGLTEVTLEYSRPAKRDRVIFGDLVPYNKMWRTGANANSTVEFSTDVTFGGKDVKAGKYAVFAKPGLSAWDVYLYNDTSNWGTPKTWEENKVAAHVNVPVTKTSHTAESFTMAVNEVTLNNAHLEVSWDRTMVAIPVGVPAEKMTQASIDKVMAGPSVNDYYQAASFYLEANKDMNKAHEWITKATSMNPKAFWMFRKQSLIEAKMGNKKAAIQSAKKSLELAQAAENADYVKMNKESLKEWGGM